MSSRIAKGLRIEDLDRGFRKRFWAKVLIIKKRIAAGESTRRVARSFGVCQRLVSDIASGKRWKHVTAKEA